MGAANNIVSALHYPDADPADSVPAHTGTAAPCSADSRPETGLRCTGRLLLETLADVYAVREH